MYDGDAVSRWSGISATGVWTAGWLAAACAAGRHVVQSPDGSALLGAGVAVLMVVLCSWLLVRLLRRGCSPRRAGPVAPSGSRSFREPWHRRIVGYLAVA